MFVNRECVSNEQWIEGKKRRCFHTKQRNIEQSIVSQCLCVFVCGTRAFVSTILVQHIVWFYNASKNGCIMDFIRKSQTKFAYGTNGPYVVQYVTPLVNIISNWGVLCIVYTACLRQPIKTNFGFSRYRCCFWFFFLYSFCFAHRLFSTQDENFFFWIESIVYGNARRKQNKKIIGKKWFALVHHLKWMIVNRLAVSLQSIFIQVFSFNDDIRDSECNELITHNNFVLRFFCSDSI